MIDATPAHIGDVQQTVEAVEVDERAEVGDVFHHTLAYVAGGHMAEHLRAFVGAFFFDELAAAEHDVLPLHVELHDFEFILLADQRLEILRWHDVHLRAGQKRLHADVDNEASLHNFLDATGDHAAFFANGIDLVPVLFELRALVAELNHPVAVFEHLNEHLNLVAHHGLVVLVKFIQRHRSLALKIDIYEHFLGSDLDDFTLNNFALHKANRALLHRFFHRQHWLFPLWITSPEKGLAFEYPRFFREKMPLIPQDFG